MSCSRNYTIDELADVKLFDAVLVKGCGPNFEGMGPGSNFAWLRSKGLNYPMENAEFTFAISGEKCGLCALDYGCECENGIDGRRGAIRRIAYTANPTECCLSLGKKTIGDKTCDPRYRNITSPDCQNALYEYCRIDGNFTKEPCKQWCKAIKSDPNARTRCDDIAIEYCKKNKGKDPKCDCLEPPKEIFDILDKISPSVPKA